MSDCYPLYLGAGLLSFGCTLVTLLAWRETQDRFFLWWGLSCAALGLGGSSAALYWASDVHAAGALAMVMTVLGYRLLHRAVHQALDRAMHPAHLLGPPLGLLALVTVNGNAAILAPDSVVALYQLTSAASLAATLRDLRLLRATQHLSGARDLGWVVTATIGWYLLRATDLSLGLGLTDWLLAGLVSTALAAGCYLGLALGRERQAQAAERAQASERERGRQEIERLLQHLPALIFRRTLSPDFTQATLLYRAGDFERVTGLSAQAFADNRSMQTLVLPEEWPRVRQAREAAVRDGHSTVEWRIRQPEGGFRWLRTTARRLDPQPGEPLEMVGYIQDITAERAAQANAAMAARLASLGDMATGMAHELRQPLTTIALAVENGHRLLAAGQAEAVALRLERIGEQARRASGMIEQLRRFARGDTTESPEPVQLDGAVQSVLALVGSRLADAGIEVDLALGAPPLRVLGRPVALEQVLYNLVSNARQAMEAQPAPAPRRLRIAAVQDGAWVSLGVADTGGGIAEAVRASLFEPFVTTREPNKGTGLGLAICHGLVQAMGGSIEARNEAGGALFTLRLPAA